MQTETVGDSMELYLSQVTNTSKMRNELTAFSKDDPLAAKKAIKNITMFRVYHQITRIVRYTEMMDKIEDRLYQCIDEVLGDVTIDSDMMLSRLMSIQSKLQYAMIESHKLLEPYLNIDELFTVDVAVDPTESFASVIMDQETREKVRTSAQKVLAELTREDANK